MRRLLVAMGFLIVVGVLVVRFGSGMVAEEAAQQYFADKKIPVKSLKISHASLRNALVNEATLGTNDALTLEGASIAYGYRDKNVDVNKLGADKIRIRMRTSGGAWDIGGLEALLGLPTLDASTAKNITDITFDTMVDVTIKDKKIAVKTSGGVLELTQDDLSATAQNIVLELTPTDSERHFGWKLSADGVVVKQKAQALTTPLLLNATGTIDEKTITGQGTVSDKGKKMPMILRLTHEMAAKKTTVQWTSNSIKLTETGKGFAVLSPLLAEIPPMNADLRMEGDVLLLPNRKPRLKQKFIIDRAALSPLLKLAFKDDIAITGELTGVIPLRWAGEKAPQVVGARLKNLAPGKLIYDPLTGASAALQGEAQAGILLEALRRFEYSTLDIDADSDAQGVLKARFHLIGANPDLYGGKTVDFTLNVNGNLLSILESNRKVNDVITKSRK